MGINTHFYTVYGIKIKGYPNDLSEEYSDNYKTIDSDPRMDIIADGLGGDYIIIGKVLFHSGDLRWNDIQDTFVQFDLTKLEEYKEEVSLAFTEHFPNLTNYLVGEWGLMTFMHLM